MNFFKKIWDKADEFWRHNDMPRAIWPKSTLILSILLFSHYVDFQHPFFEYTMQAAGWCNIGFWTILVACFPQANRRFKNPRKKGRNLVILTLVGACPVVTFPLFIPLPSNQYISSFYWVGVLFMGAYSVKSITTICIDGWVRLSPWAKAKADWKRLVENAEKVKRDRAAYYKRRKQLQELWDKQPNLVCEYFCEDTCNADWHKKKNFKRFYTNRIKQIHHNQMLRSQCYTPEDQPA